MDQTSQRAGVYVQQPTGYKAFIPRALPPEPHIAIDDELLDLHSKADRALGRLDGFSNTLPNPDLFVAMYVRKEAVLSSQIEGTQASLTDILEFEAKAATPGNPHDVEEVVNYIRAMNHGLTRLKSLPVSLRLVREIHERLMDGVRGSQWRPGEFRRSQNWIGPAGSTITTARYVPPPPHEMESALGNWESFLHAEGPPSSPLLRVGIAHAQFETIHPFLDGNGRIGRLLITFLLCEKEILKRPLLYLSYYLKRFRQEYYERLQAIRDHGDWENWLKFFLRGVAEVSGEATAVAGRIVSVREANRSLITQKMGKGSGTALTVMERLFDRPIVTVKIVAADHRLSIPQANNVVNELARLGILKETTGRQRDRIFRYEPYLSLFADEPHGGTASPHRIDQQNQQTENDDPPPAT